MRPLAIALLLPFALTPQDRALRPIEIGARKALVIGNAAYPPGATLRNPVNDARALRDSLRRLGFTVTLAENLTKRQLADAAEAFAQRLGERDLALVYFAGHGVQVEGENYLVPVDFQGRSEADVQYDAYPASKLRARLEETRARVRLLVFDACRNNPYRFKRSGATGLAPMASNAEGTAIIFGAGDGQTADDNAAAANGLFTTKLLSALETPGLGLDQIFKRVQAEVYAASGGKQLPAVYDQVVGSLVLRAGVVAPFTPLDDEPTYWRACEERRGEFCKIYLRRYPNGRFAPLAEAYSRAAPGRAPPVVTPAPPADQGQPIVKDGLTYVRIPAGEFVMGCRSDSSCGDDEKPPVRVRITKPFFVGETEVTQVAYERTTGKKNPSHFRGADRPVENVSWHDAANYCAAIGLRLPTEAEWEWAARGGLITARQGSVNQVGWYDENSGGHTHPVKQKLPNGYGLYDMLGNVWEWTSTWYSGNPIGGTDPEGANSGTQRVLRGGSWSSVSRDLRVSLRLRSGPLVRLNLMGFRCAGD
jgi:formylglycine-generating enzyme required for sulfatase activity